jgi:hypothetical protein
MERKRGCGLKEIFPKLSLDTGDVKYNCSFIKVLYHRDMFVGVTQIKFRKLCTQK